MGAGRTSCNAGALKQGEGAEAGRRGRGRARLERLVLAVLGGEPDRRLPDSMTRKAFDRGAEIALH